MRKEESLKFLIIDDEDIARSVLSGFLIVLYPDAHIDVCCDGFEALSWLANGRGKEYQYIFCDFNMPMMNGYEVIKQCLEENKVEPHRIILITGSGVTQAEMEANIRKTLQLGIRGALTKPFSCDNIKRILSV